MDETCDKTLTEVPMRYILQKRSTFARIGLIRAVNVFVSLSTLTQQAVYWLSDVVTFLSEDPGGPC